MKKLLPIFLILSILAIVYGAKRYQYPDSPQLNSEIENIYLEMQRGIRVNVGSFACPTETGNYSVTGVGFKPRVVTFISGKDSVSRAQMGHGWMDYNGNSFSVTIGSQDDEQQTEVSATYCIYEKSYAGVDVIKAKFVSMDNDGFTLEFVTVGTDYLIGYKTVR